MLINSSSSIAFKKNVATEAKTKPIKQAVAIAYATKRRNGGKATLSQVKAERRAD